MCPKHETASSLVAIGCRRGSLTTQVPLMVLCPIIQSKDASQHKIGIQKEITSIPENDYLEERIGKRTAIMKSIDSSWMEASSGELSGIRPQLLELWKKSAYSKMQGVASPAPVPVNSCVLDIIWELMEFPSIGSLSLEAYNKVLLFLYAAQYQALLETVSTPY
jgi:hypothetical protein